MVLNRVCTAAVCGWLCLAPPGASAQVPANPDPIVITAARLAQPLSQVPLDLRVIERAQIEAAGVSGLAELLQRLAGAEISASGGPGQPSGVFLRGSNASHVVLLIDGVRVNSATSGSNALEHLPLNQIERIEVLSGPASGLYGADAIGGVIQIFTRRSDGVQARIGLGSQRTRSADASVGRQTGATRWSLQGGWRATQADSAATPDNAFGAYNPDHDAHRNANAGATLAHDWAAGHGLLLRGSVSDSRTRLDAGPGPAGQDVNDQRLSTLAVESRDRVATGWTSQLRLARGRDEAVTRGVYASRFGTTQDQFTWQNDLRLGGGQVAAGLEWRRERVDASTAFTETERQVRSAFGGYALDLGRTQWQFALRHDDNSQFGGRGTGNAGWQFALAPGWTLSAAAGTAFRAPSFNDLYYPYESFSFGGFSYAYSGNPALRAERSRSVEFGTRYARGDLALRATVFDNRIRDLIAIENTAISPVETSATVANVERARIRGLTLGGRWAAGAWAARAEATFQTPENQDTGSRLVRRAQRHGSAGLDWAAGPWRLGAELVASGARYDDAANSAAARMGGYGLLNLQAAWAVRPGWTLAASLDNAADKAYTLTQGFDPGGRRLFVSLAHAGP